MYTILVLLVWNIKDDPGEHDVVANSPALSMGSLPTVQGPSALKTPKKVRHAGSFCQPRSG
jgi:hypothetical protein